MKINIPDTIKLGTYEIKVTKHGEGVLERVGHYRPYYQEIQLDNTRSREMMTETFIHEIIEAIDHHYEVDLKHRQISLLSMVLTQVLTDMK